MQVSHKKKIDNMLNIAQLEHKLATSWGQQEEGVITTLIYLQFI